MLWKRMIGLAVVAVMCSTTSGLAGHEETDVGTFVRARIAIGEMMVNYFEEQGGMAAFTGKDGRPSREALRRMREDISMRLNEVLAAHNLTVDEYRQRSRDVFADEEAVQDFLDEHPNLKARYEALPMERGGYGHGY